MYYLVSLNSKNMLAKLGPDHIKQLKDGIEAAISRGAVVAAYNKVGGGMVLIVNSPSNAQLAVELRKHQITDAEVTPLVPLLALLDGHMEFHATGQIKA